MTRRSLAVLGTLISLLFLVAAPASAHTELTSSTPANGAITLAATAGLRTACVYSRIIDISAASSTMFDSSTRFAIQPKVR